MRDQPHTRQARTTGHLDDLSVFRMAERERAAAIARFFSRLSKRVRRNARADEPVTARRERSPALT